MSAFEYQSSPASRPSLLTRLRRTTLTELFRGRLSAGHSPETIIFASGLDAPTRALVAEICKRTRLRNDERVDVARELIAHFADGRDAGVAPDMLIRAFGDLTAAARLIRRAKIRNRSLLWHAFRFVRRALGVLIVVYIGLAVYYSNGKPNVSVDYIAKLNEPILQIPADQRAWPLYNKVAETLGNDPQLKTRIFDGYVSASERNWPTIVAWLKSNHQVLSLIDQATARRSMGFVYGPEGSVREIKDLAQPVTNPSDPFHHAFISVLLPQLNGLRSAAYMVAADARLAADEKDANRWMRRIDEIRKAANHSRAPGVVVSYLVEIGIETTRLDQIERMLTDHPDLLSEEQLTQLAHQNAVHYKPSDVMSFDVERLVFQDMVQRVYTDDGHGDGHLSAQGIANIQMISNSTIPTFRQNAGIEVAKYALSPAAALLSASRKDLTEKYNQAMDRMQRNIDRPWRERRDEIADVDALELKSSFLKSYRYALLAILLPSLDRASLTAERFLVQRDAVQVGIALELFRRKTGHYPATLAELSPLYLPSVPLDPCDGQPMRYAVRDGKPVVYSIGVDLNDDGGVAPFLKTGAKRISSELNGSELAIGQSPKRFDGDWILYPTVRAPEVDASEDENPESTDPATQPGA